MRGMHHDQIHRWEHGHSFGQDHRRPGESRTVAVIAITASMMVVEIAAGIGFKSMALLADGLHMASHAAALTITAVAYAYARRHARDPQYSFGTGKVNALGGFTGAVLLAAFAFLMAGESVGRLISPVTIAFNQAIVVAVLGLLVNGASVLILGHDDHTHNGHSHSHHDHSGHAHGHDHNLRSAYLHVLADALMSILAIGALLLAKYFGLVWMDPVMGVVGAVLVARWSLGLLRATSGVLLDRQQGGAIGERIRACVEQDSDSRVADLHVWSIGPGIHAVIVSIVAHDPKQPQDYKRLLPKDLGLAHVTIEVHECAEDPRRLGGVEAGTT